MSNLSNIETTKEFYISHLSLKTQIVYSNVLLAVIAVFVALPFIYFDVTVQAEGLIRPVAEKAMKTQKNRKHVVKHTQGGGNWHLVIMFANEFEILKSKPVQMF